MQRVIAKVYLSAGQINRVVKTGPNTSVQFRGGCAQVVDERSIMNLLRHEDMEIEYDADWYDFYPKHLEGIGGIENQKAKVIAVVKPEPVVAEIDPGVNYTVPEEIAAPDDLSEEVGSAPVLAGKGRHK